MYDTALIADKRDGSFWLKEKEQIATAAIHLRVNGLFKNWKNGEKVLKNISFSMRKGQSLALIGHNGSGKSTLLRCCLRLIEPSSGTIHLLDREITGLPRHRVRSTCARVGFIFQRHNLVPRLSVLSNVIHGAQARKKGPRVWYQSLACKEDREEAMHCLDRVGLAHLAARRADQLSGGESQRVAIARALMQKPQMMMADEPVASLDPQAGEEVMELFLSLLEKEGLTFLFVSHNLDHALRYSKRIIGLKKGCLALDSLSINENETSLHKFFS